MNGGVVVVHAWWGLNDDVNAYAERLRRQGYATATPDLYAGRVATTIEGAEALRDQMDPQHAMAEVAAALTDLSRRADRVAVLGWSLGVWYGWRLAQLRATEIQAVVSYYGLGEVDAKAQLPPLLGHYAEQDDFEALADVRRTEQQLVTAGRIAEFHVYRNTRHWFDEPSRPEFDRDASALAFSRTLTFLETHLRR